MGPPGKRENMIENAVSSLAQQAVDATSERLLEIASPLQEKLQDKLEEKLAVATRREKHRLRRLTLWSFVFAAIGVGVFVALQRRAQMREVAPDAYGDAVEREGARDFATLT
jgi:hypothetical protein